MTSLGSDTLNVLVSPEVDTFRLANPWTTDFRVAWAFRVPHATVRLVGDLFNAFNATRSSSASTTSARPPSTGYRRT